MSELLMSLESILQAEVDKRVAAVQAAADAAVAQFREVALKIARGEPHATPFVPPPIATLPPHVEPQESAFQLPAAVLEELGGAFETRMQVDEAAAHANMAVR